MPAFARMFTNISMPVIPVPKDLQKGQMPICPYLQKSPKYRACHRALVKNLTCGRKFPTEQMPDMPVPANFEMGKCPFACA